MKRFAEISLSPYVGRLFVAATRKDYERAHRRMFNESDNLAPEMGGRYSAGTDKSGNWLYLVWSEGEQNLAHELAHVILHVFKLCGIDPREANGEPFCYMLSQLIMDTRKAIGEAMAKETPKEATP